jgi:hypothetical protein
MHRCKVTTEAGMGSQPGLNLAAFVHFQSIEHQKDVGVGSGKLLI